jgi:hypothetical protein
MLSLNIMLIWFILYEECVVGLGWVGTISNASWIPYRSRKIASSTNPLCKEVVSFVDSDSPSAFENSHALKQSNLLGLSLSTSATTSIAR